MSREAHSTRELNSELRGLRLLAELMVAGEAGEAGEGGENFPRMKRLKAAINL